MKLKIKKMIIKKKEEIDEKEIPKDANDILLSNEEKGNIY